MCLNTKSFAYSIAEKDIKCYKVILWRDGEYMTPYQKTPIQKNVLDGKMPFFAGGVKRIEEINYNSDNTDTFSNTYVIGEGFIHTYKSLISARYLKYHLGVMYPDYFCCIFECEIPKDARYYEGEDDFFEDGFASEKIKFVKETDL